MNNRCKFTVIITTFFILALASLSTHAQSDNDSIEKILEGTGINKLIQHVPNLAMATLKQSAFAMDDPQINSQLAAAFQKSFTQENIKQDVIASLKTNYDARLSNDFLALLADPLSQKMSTLERASSDPANRQAMMEFAEEMDKHPAPASRMQLIQRLDTANRASEFSVNLQLALFKSVFTAVNPVLDAEMKISDDEMETMTAEVRESIEQDIIKRVQLSYLYAFRNLDDSELEAYVTLSELETNRKSNQRLTSAVITAINLAADRSAHSMLLGTSR